MSSISPSLLVSLGVALPEVFGLETITPVYVTVTPFNGCACKAF